MKNIRLVFGLQESQTPRNRRVERLKGQDGRIKGRLTARGRGRL